MTNSLKSRAKKFSPSEKNQRAFTRAWIKACDLNPWTLVERSAKSLFDAGRRAGRKERK
jgi:hypothetical protein